MKKLFAVVAACAAIQLSYASTSHNSWGYEQHNGPSTWGSKPDYQLCEMGQMQSPIDIISKQLSFGKQELNVGYGSATIKIFDNGHTLQADLVGKQNNFLQWQDNTYQLLQFHFHSPSEHTVNGKQYPMVMHFVNADPKGNLAVLGVFVTDKRRRNRTLNKILRSKANAQQFATKTLTINLNHILPDNFNEIFQYSGSLTTPPCTQGVTWLVAKTPLQASQKQITFFEKYHHENIRPVQALNGRDVARINISYAQQAEN